MTRKYNNYINGQNIDYFANAVDKPTGKFLWGKKGFVNSYLYSENFVVCTPTAEQSKDIIVDVLTGEEKVKASWENSKGNWEAVRFYTIFPPSSPFLALAKSDKNQELFTV